jgi:spore maturation protein CgeB
MTSMRATYDIAFFGSSLVSAYWNGAATYYRGIVRALHERGHRVTFYEPDAFDRQAHRDIPDPEWAQVEVYPGDADGALAALERARGADIVVKASGVGAQDELLERAVLQLRGSGTLVCFWDVDAPATLERVHLATPPAAVDPFRALIPQFDLVLTYGGGAPVVAAYRALGARVCVPIYNAVDPSTHYPVAPQAQFTGLCGFLGNRLPDREARVREFFFTAAARLPHAQFLLGGSGWDERDGAPPNVTRLGHVYTRDHNAFNCSPRAVLNVNRDSMARTGFSPPTRVFEAAGAGACLIMDAWDGVEQFLEPQREVLVAKSGAEVAELLAALREDEARRIGRAALARVLAEHTYAHRALAFEQAVEGHGASPHTAAPVGAVA